MGLLYFTKEIYDATYPGYGSTYGDLHGSLSLLFEQASTKGHLLETPTGEISFAFAIRNQFIATFSTIKASIKNKDILYNYQNNFNKNAIEKASKSKIKAYVFGDNFDKNRNKEFLNLLLKHKIDVYNIDQDVKIGNQNYKKGSAFIVPTQQAKYYMVQTMFETFDKYRDSVYYDASSWSMANFYNMKYKALTKHIGKGEQITKENNIIEVDELEKSSYAYLISWDDYYVPKALYKLMDKELVVKAATQPFSKKINGELVSFKRGTLLISMSNQSVGNEEVYNIVKHATKPSNIKVYAVKSGFSSAGIDLGSRKFIRVKKPKVMMLVEGGVSVYEAGEVWHLFEQRMEMPIVKVPERSFNNLDLEKYNVMIMVSGNYKSLNQKNKDKLKAWITKGNTLITTRTASLWVIKNKIVNESLINITKDSTNKRLDYIDSRGTIGKQKIGGVILEVSLDLSHPIAFGYHDKKIPVYKNNNIFLSLAKSRFSTVAKYTSNPHIDGYVSQENMDNYLTKSASIIVSRVGKGRVVLFADNPNFRGAWYGTNKLFMNAVFFGSIIKVVD